MAGWDKSCGGYRVAISCHPGTQRARMNKMSCNTAGRRAAMMRVTGITGARDRGAVVRTAGMSRVIPGEARHTAD